MQRPETGKVRNYFNIYSGTAGLAVSRGNPYLKPTTAWQFDLTGEWYFSRVGSLTLDLFYKSVHNFYYDKLTSVDLTFNGVTQSVDALQPANYSGYGKIKGFELAYQQVFSFLPAPLNGFGVKGDYTYVHSNGLPSSFINGNSFLASPSITVGDLPMANLSKHTFNVEVFYENSLISARAAYNWRSKFLLTPADAIAPYFPIYNGAAGQLDASLFVNVMKNVKVGVQGVNLLNGITKTYQDYGNPSGDLALRSAFMNDRRFSFILRGSF